MNHLYGLIWILHRTLSSHSLFFSSSHILFPSLPSLFKCFNFRNIYIYLLTTHTCTHTHLYVSTLVTDILLTTHTCTHLHFFPSPSPQSPPPQTYSIHLSPDVYTHSLFVEYGMPSSHAQFMAFFATYFTLFLFFR